MTGYYGRLPRTEDARDYRYRPRRPYTGQSVDLSGGFAELPYNQLSLGSCVSQGTAAAVDYARIKQGLAPLKRPSRLFVYYNGRVIGKYPLNQDTGLEIRDGFSSIAKYGAPNEDQDWPYDISKFAVKPPAQAYADGALDEAVTYGSVALGDIDATIAGGYVVVWGFNVYASFESAATAQTGVMPVPKRGEKLLGGHCTVACSTPVDGSTIPGGVAGVQYRLTLNSWGHDGTWGLPTKPGYYYHPVSDTSISDCWVVKAMTAENPPIPPVTPTAADKAMAAAARAWLLARNL